MTRQTTSTSSTWQDSITALRSYREIRGSADFSTRIRAHGIDLGKWVARCRDDYWHGQLSDDQIRELESVDGWQWGPARPGSWRHGFNILSDYAARHGTTILIEHTIIDGIDLRAWVTAQRQSYLNLELAGTQIRLLQRLPAWDWDIERARWRQGVVAATLYIEQHRSLGAVQRQTRLGDYPLGQWLHRCREDFRAGTMPKDRAAQLEVLPGWSWGREHQNWDDGLKVLRKYVAQTGHASPGQHTVIDGYPIGRWVTQRRRQHKHGTFPQDRAAILESLPGWQWEPLENQWRQGLTALTHYAAAHGHANPTRGETINGYPIGEWVRAQRSAHHRGWLSTDRTIQLAALPGWRWRAQPTKRN